MVVVPEVDEGFILHRELLRTPRSDPLAPLDRLDRLDAERDILDTLYAYAMFYDAADLDGVVDVFTNDALLVNIVGTFRGSEEIRAHFLDLTSRVSRAIHYTVNPVIRVESIERARSASFLYALGADNSGAVRGTAGTYSDVLVRCSDGKWRIAERRITADLSYVLAKSG